MSEFENQRIESIRKMMERADRVFNDLENRRTQRMLSRLAEIEASPNLWFYQPDSREWVDGLPPVGSTQDDCAIRCVSKTDSFEVIAHRDGKAIVYFTASPQAVTTVKPDEFRPLKTDAEQRRESAISNAFKALPKSETASCEWDAHAERVIAALYDAGMLREGDI